jgi:hypothetical protein
MLIIDPPVTRYSPSHEIQAWVEELERRLENPEYDEDDRRVIRRNLERAKSWLPAGVGSAE